MIFGSPLDRVRNYLTSTITEADRQGQPVSDEVARVIAALLAPLLPGSSALRRAAISGRIGTDPADIQALRAECARIAATDWRAVAEINQWAHALDHHLATR